MHLLFGDHAIDRSDDCLLILAIEPVDGEGMLTPQPEVDRGPGNEPAIESCPVSRPLQSAPRRLRKV